MARKTIDVESIKAHANVALSDPAVIARQNKHYGDAAAQAYRRGVAAVLETILMDTGNYRGFRYADLNHGNADATRRAYY